MVFRHGMTLTSSSRTSSNSRGNGFQNLVYCRVVIEASDGPEIKSSLARVCSAATRILFVYPSPKSHPAIDTIDM